MTNVKKIGFAEFRKNIIEYTNLAKYKNERFLLIKHGQPIGAFVPFEDLEMILSQSQKDSEIHEELSKNH